MGTLPRARTTVQDTATAKAAGQKLICILAPVPTSADIVPRQFGGADQAYAQHGYSEGVEYAALHVENTGLPFLFVGLPIATPGVVGRFDDTGNTDTSIVSAAVGGSGCLAEHDGVVKAASSGTIGADQILLDLSLDGGRTFKRVRLSTATSYVIPFIGVTLSFAAGDLTEGDTLLTWHGTSPRAASASITTARENLAAKLKFFRKCILIGDVQNSTEALAFNTELDAYATANDRFISGRAGVPELLPLPVMSTNAGSLTFANTGETITRASGSWVSDGFKVGQTVDIEGTDGGTNDVSADIVTLSPTVMTLEAAGVTADETSPATQVSITVSQTRAAHVAAQDAAFAAVDAKKRVDLSYGRAAILSPFSGYWFRRPAAWDAAVREYQNDVHIPTWQKADGPVLGTLFDVNDDLVEYDDRVYGGAASGARFTSYRTYSNGPAGAFISQSLTREVDASLLSQSHNVDVVNIACTVVQLNSELAIGQSLVLNLGGTATEDALTTIEDRVNNALRAELLEDKQGQGPRASFVRWQASRDNILNVPEATLTGVCTIQLNGTIHSVETTVRVLSGGQA